MVQGNAFEVINALTIDVEDYYQVSAFERHIHFDHWSRYESRVVRNTQRILEILAISKVTATFFILGWVAERFPKLVDEIHRLGHEVASHGYAHRLVYKMTPKEFREDVRKAKGILEHIIQHPVVGYRATSYSIITETLWGLDILIEEGFEYDSSIFPIVHDRYGVPGSSRFPHVIRRGNGKGILEFPLSTISLLGWNVPVAGGGYFRLFPYGFIRWGLRRINRDERQPAIFYLHPWEIDVEQPRLQGGFLSRFRHYVNLDKTEGRFRQLLSDFRFGPVQEVLGALPGGVAL